MKRVPTILLLEDDAFVRKHLAGTLEEAGFAVTQAANCAEGWYFYETKFFDLLVLDVQLPDGNGLELLKKIRSRDKSVPAIILTVLGNDGDLLHGFSCGADNYLVKPIDARVFLAHVKSIFRRATSSPKTRGNADFCAKTLDRQNREFVCGNARYSLTAREFAFLDYLESRAGTTVSEQEILSQAWRLDSCAIDSARVHILLSRLRRKIPAANFPVKTVYGHGWRWE